MHLLVEFENVRAAYALADYLNVQGIPCEVTLSKGLAGIYVHDQAQLPKAELELRAFLHHPTNKKYLSGSLEKVDSNVDRENTDEAYQQGAGQAAKRWAETGPFTKTIILLCAVVFLITAFGADRQMVSHFFFFSRWDDIFDLTQIWRWVSPVFLHFGFLHFTFNLLWWWDIASLIESMQGPSRLFNIFMVLSIVPNLAQFSVNGHLFGGLSGVVFGVLGYVWVYGQVRKDYPLQMRPVIMLMMLIWLLIGFTGVLDKVIGPMANEIHLAGLVCGGMLGYVYAMKDQLQFKS